MTPPVLPTLAVALGMICSAWIAPAPVVRASAPMPSGPPRNTAQPRELGLVQWKHNLEEALAEANASGKPVLLLFQEIPGCDVCQMFGDQPLTHPLLVDAIETLFVPVAISNNKPGYDEQILRRFQEPAQNYPVMRFLDGEGRDLIARQDGIHGVSDVSKRLIEALATAGRDVPEYLKIAMLEGQNNREHRERFTFAMHCFWDGEARLGAINGVTSTRACFYENQEAVYVEFDPTVVSIEDLMQAADKSQCADAVYAHGDVQMVHARSVLGERVKPSHAKIKPAPESDQLYSLERSPMRFLPLTPMQAMKVNASLRLDDDPRRWLTARQAELLLKITAALANSPGSLDGLKRPSSIEALRTYREQLESRLNRTKTK